MVQTYNAQLLLPAPTTSSVLAWFVRQVNERPVPAPVQACPVSARSVGLFTGDDE